MTSHQPLWLEFAPRARKVSLSSKVLLALAVLTLGASAAALALGWAENVRQMHQLDELPSRSSPHLPPLVRASVHDPQELARIAIVRKTARNLATPWAELLAALEATPGNVALLSVEPSATRRSVTLTAETNAPKHMLAYLRTLQSDPRFKNIVLVSHQIQAQTPGTPLRFQLEGQWGDTP